LSSGFGKQKNNLRLADNLIFFLVTVGGGGHGSGDESAGIQFNCFTSTEVQILTRRRVAAVPKPLPGEVFLCLTVACLTKPDAKLLPLQDNPTNAEDVPVYSIVISDCGEIQTAL